MDRRCHLKLSGRIRTSSLTAQNLISPDTLKNLHPIDIIFLFKNLRDSLYPFCRNCIVNYLLFRATLFLKISLNYVDSSKGTKTAFQLDDTNIVSIFFHMDISDMLWFSCTKPEHCPFLSMFAFCVLFTEVACYL